MKGMKRNEQEDIAEKLRVEETKKQLEAARIGMEKEAQRLKEEQAAAEAKKKEREGNRFGAAAANVGSGIGGASKWVPSRMRNTMPSPSVGASRFGAAATATGYQKKVDTKDEELFPDLATADKLIQQEEAQKAEKAAAAAAANRARAIASKPRWGMKAEKEEKKPEEVKETPAPTPAPAPVAAPAPAPTAVKKKKKKKKDLSTFKAS